MYPKKLVILQGYGHYEVYAEPALSEVMRETLDSSLLQTTQRAQSGDEAQSFGEERRVARAEHYSGGKTSSGATSRRWVEKIQRVPSVSTAR